MILLREATIHDLSILTLWDEQQHIIESDPNDDWNWEQELLKKHPWREQLMAELHNNPIGFVQIINPAQEESHYWGAIEEGYRAIDIWIGDIENTGKGYGRGMMTQALRRCFTNEGVHTGLIDPLTSNTWAIRFYEKIGFRFLEERKFGDDECKVYQIKKSYWDAMNH